MTTKRIGISFTALFLCIVMCLSISACGKKETTTDKLNAFINSIQDEIDAMRKSFGDEMDMKVSARDDSLVYSFQYKIDTEIDNKTLAEALDASLDLMASTFTTILSSLKKEVADAKSVIVEYLDKDGTLITSKEFK